MDILLFIFTKLSWCAEGAKERRRRGDVPFPPVILSSLHTSLLCNQPLFYSQFGFDCLNGLKILEGKAHGHVTQSVCRKEALSTELCATGIL